MRIEMIAQISGSRDGVDWPAPGGVIDVDDVEAEDLLKAGLAQNAKASSLPPVEKAIARKAETRKGLTKGSMSA